MWWRHRPVKFADLQRYRLIGLCTSPQRHHRGRASATNTSAATTSNMEYLLPASVRNYVSVLDVEERQYSGCQYPGSGSGGFLKQAVLERGECTRWDDTLIPLLHAACTELAMKALLLYHHASPQPPLGTQYNRHRTEAYPRDYIRAVSEWEEGRRQLLAQIGINTPADMQIIQYLAKLIQIHAEEQRAVNINRDVTSSSIHNPPASVSANELSVHYSKRHSVYIK